MGYYTFMQGEIRFDPPVDPETLPRDALNFWDGDNGPFRINAQDSTIEPYGEDQTKAYSVVEDVQRLVDLLPGRTFTGYISGEGEDNDDMWRLAVVDGKATKFAPQIVWPQEVR